MEQINAQENNSGPREAAEFYRRNSLPKIEKLSRKKAAFESELKGIVAKREELIQSAKNKNAKFYPSSTLVSSSRNFLEELRLAGDNSMDLYKESLKKEKDLQDAINFTSARIQKKAQKAEKMKSDVESLLNRTKARVYNKKEAKEQRRKEVMELLGRSLPAKKEPETVASIESKEPTSAIVPAPTKLLPADQKKIN